MRTQVMQAGRSALKQGARLIAAGQLVAFPTETVYGLGADALSDAATRGIFAAKGRPMDNPLIVHIADMAAAEPLVRTLTPLARELMTVFWPGPLTLVMPAAACVPPSVTAGLGTVGLRMPGHPVALGLIRAAGRPIAAPSANASGRPSPTTAAHVLADMAGRIPLIIDGGACEVGLESTVLDIAGQVPRVLRPGAVTPEMIAAVAGEVQVDPAVLALGSLADPFGAARGLFDALREADERQAQMIFAEAVDAKGIGLAVMNRLARAAGFEIEEA